MAAGAGEKTWRFETENRDKSMDRTDASLANAAGGGRHEDRPAGRAHEQDPPLTRRGRDGPRPLPARPPVPDGRGRRPNVTHGAQMEPRAVGGANGAHIIPNGAQTVPRAVGGAGVLPNGSHGAQTCTASTSTQPRWRQVRSPSTARSALPLLSPAPRSFPLSLQISPSLALTFNLLLVLFSTIRLGFQTIYKQHFS